MPLLFPPSPTNGQTYTDDNSVVWQYNGTVWNVVTGTTRRLFSGVKVGFSTNYALDVTPAAVAWDVESIDTDSFWNVAQATRITIPATGYYNLNINLFSDTAGSLYTLNIKVNGSSTIISGTISPNQSADYNETQYFNAGDYIELYASENTSAGSLTSGSYIELSLLGYGLGTGVSSYAAFSGVKAVLSSTFSTTVTPTAVAWSSTSWDVNANALALTYWSAGTPGRLTIKTTGFYLVNVNVESDNQGGTYTVTLRKNGVTTITSATIGANDGAFLNQTFSLVANDYLEVLVSDTLASGGITTASYFELIRQGV